MTARALAWRTVGAKPGRAALAVAGRGQQPVHHSHPCLGGVIGEESSNFIGCQWQADQVKGDAADERPLIGRAKWLDGLFTQLCGDEAIYRMIQATGRIFWRRIFVDWLKRPVSSHPGPDPRTGRGNRIRR